MRILMLSQFYAPIPGGLQQMVRDLSLTLVQGGHSVAVATLWNPGTLEYEVDGGVRIYRLRSLVQRIPGNSRSREEGRQHAPPWPDPGVMSALHQIIQREQPEVVHAHDWLVYSFLPLKVWGKARLVMTLHEYGAVCAKHRLMHRGRPCAGPALVKCLACASAHYGHLRGIPITLANRLMSTAERAAVDLFLPISQAVAEGDGLVRHRLPYHIVPDFVLDETETGPANLAAYVSQLPAEPYILYVGDLSRDKGVHILLQAYAELEHAPPLALIGRHCDDLPAHLPPNVHLLNSWPHAAVLEAWRRSLLAVVPSVWAEPFGIVALEAMAAGRAVIASQTGGLTDIVLPGETGLLVPPGDVTALRQALGRLLQDANLREQFGQAGLRRVASFRASVIVPHIDQLYRHLVQPVPSRGAIEAAIGPRRQP